MPIVFEGRVFSVEVSTVRFPDGHEHRQEIVRHPPCVVLVPVDDAGHVILVRQYRAPIDRETWELPAGSLDPGEPADAAARRELEEETGFRPDRVERICSFFPSPGFCDEEMIFFLATGLRRPPADDTRIPDADEHITVKAFTLARARAMIAAGEIVDLKTAYGLARI
jgi:ADP-ribose pyrophosphatase